MRTETLLRMADHIAANNSAFDDDKARDRIADHLAAFWTPSMLEQLADYGREHPDELDPRVTTALARLTA